MSRWMRLATVARDNPVIVLEVVKYTLGLLIVFGLPIPPGVDVAVASLVVAGLTLVTRSLVSPVSRSQPDVSPDVR